MRPRRRIERQPMPESSDTALGHPRRLALLGGNQTHDLLVQPFPDQFGIDIGRKTVLILLFADMLQQLFFILSHSYGISCKDTKCRAQCQINLTLPRPSIFEEVKDTNKRGQKQARLHFAEREYLGRSPRCKNIRQKKPPCVPANPVPQNDRRQDNTPDTAKTAASIIGRPARALGKRRSRK